MHLPEDSHVKLAAARAAGVRRTRTSPLASEQDLRFECRLDRLPHTRETTPSRVHANAHLKLAAARAPGVRRTRTSPLASKHDLRIECRLDSRPHTRACLDRSAASPRRVQNVNGLERLNVVGRGRFQLAPVERDLC